jgi:pimeloyl-ACP methyl ester carboxylesterase
MLATVPARDETLGAELTVLDQTTPELPTLIANLAEHLGVPAPKRLLPLSLVRHLPAALTGLQREALGFLSEDRYDTISGEAHAAAAGLALPNLGQSLTRWCDELVSTRFGAAPLADRGRHLRGTFVVGDPEQAEFVFLHGLPWNGDAFRPIANRLEVPSLRVDLPGLGRSAADLEGEVEERWLLRLLESRTRPVVLVGHSLGAARAVRFARAYPERVSALVLIAPTFFLKPASSFVQLEPAVAHVLRHSKVEQLARRLLPDGIAITPEIRETLESAAYDLRRAGVACRAANQLARHSRASNRAALLSSSAELTCPVQLIHGSLEPLTHAPQWKTSTIDGGGHAVHVSHPSEVAAVLRSTWRQLAYKGGGGA